MKELKPIKIDGIQKLIQKINDEESRSKTFSNTIKLHRSTYNNLMQIKKANKMKSVSSVIDYLLLTTYMAQQMED